MSKLNNHYKISIVSTNLKSVYMNFDPSDVALLERGQHVQYWVEAAPSSETKVRITQFGGFLPDSRLNLFNSKSKHLCLAL